MGMCVRVFVCVNVLYECNLMPLPFDIVHLLSVLSFVDSLSFFVLAGFSPWPCWPGDFSAASALYRGDWPAAGVFDVADTPLSVPECEGCLISELLKC